MRRRLPVIVSIIIFHIVLCSATVTTREKHEEFAQKVAESHTKDGSHDKKFDNDVIWGDENAGEDGIDDLTSEEKIERLRSLVKHRIDKDRDGFVSLEELTEWAERSYDLFEIDDTKETFPEVDTDVDGAIQWQEYVDDSHGVGFSEDSEDFKNPPSTEWQEIVKTYHNDKKRFQTSDLDGNGKLDLEEYLIFKHPRRHKETGKLLIEETLESTDLNKDGGIDVEEFVGEFAKNEDEDDPHWTVMEREKFEAELDLNKDGLLTGDEILHWVSPSNRALAVEEAEHLMDETDLNHDDKLSVDEILNNVGDWVDSDALDYGKQLLKHHDEL